MVIFKCPYCRTAYEMTTAYLSSSAVMPMAKFVTKPSTAGIPRNLLIFTLRNASKSETPDIQR
jgi:hypothetical protein